MRIMKTINDWESALHIEQALGSTAAKPIACSPGILTGPRQSPPIACSPGILTGPQQSPARNAVLYAVRCWETLISKVHKVSGENNGTGFGNGGKDPQLDTKC